MVSSAPQIRYPDCYGIDMAKLEGLIAFRAMLSLLKDQGLEGEIEKVYKEAKTELLKKDEDMTNVVQQLYDHFTQKQISSKISEMLSAEVEHSNVEIIFNTIENLHLSCPKNLGDWYFSGNYPTFGGNRVVNRSFVNFYEGKNHRAY